MNYYRRFSRGASEYLHAYLHDASADVASTKTRPNIRHSSEPYGAINDQCKRGQKTASSESMSVLRTRPSPMEPHQSSLPRWAGIKMIRSTE